MEDVKEQVTEEIVEQEVVETIVEEKPKRTRRTKAEMEAARLKESKNVEETKSVNDTEEKSSDEEISAIDEENIPVINVSIEDNGELKWEPHVTVHKFAPNEKVFVADFCQNRDTQGYTKIVNSFRFSPKAGEIERVIITDKVQYKLKNRAGSLFDEEDVCHTEEEAEKLCEIKNRR